MADKVNFETLYDPRHNDLNIRPDMPPLTAQLWCQTPITIDDAHGGYDKIRIRTEWPFWVIERGIDYCDDNWEPHGYCGTVWIEEFKIPATRLIEEVDHDR